MTRPALDLSTEAARYLALVNHVPEEYWVDEYGYKDDPYVRCEMCWQAWPCATRNALISLDPISKVVSVNVEALKALVALFDTIAAEESFFTFEDYERILAPHLDTLHRLTGLE